MSGSNNSLSPAQQQAQAQQVDDNIQRLIRSVASEVTQQIASGTIQNPGASNNQISVNLANVGLVKGFVVEVSAAVTNTGTAAATLTDFGPANVLSGIQFTDLDNYQRINTTGLHVAMLNAAKEGFPFGAALLSSSIDGPMAWGNNSAGNVISATSSIAAGGTGTINMMFWVPLSYTAGDLRGAVYMGVVNATASLGLTINPAPGVTAGDGTLACYSGANTAVSFTSVTYKVYQVYLDQLPRYTSGAQLGKPILPPLSISTQYRLINTALSGVVAGQDFPVPFTNFQQFLSLGLIYDQAGTRNGGSDINYFALTTANTYTLFKIDPYLQMLKHRMRIKTDYPKGFYNFDFRNAPIDTNQSGNMQLLLNAKTAAAGSTVLALFESFALVQAVLGAQSLPAS